MGRDGRSRYLVVALRGGLGNQLFQYASGLGLATTLSADLRFDSAELRAGEEWLPRIVGERYREADARELARLGITRGGSTLRDRVVRRAVRQVVETERRLRGMTPPRSCPPVMTATTRGATAKSSHRSTSPRTCAATCKASVTSPTLRPSSWTSSGSPRRRFPRASTLDRSSQ